jgi:hypothetical protein
VTVKILLGKGAGIQSAVGVRAKKTWIMGYRSSNENQIARKDIVGPEGESFMKRTGISEVLE